ncbi:MAG: DinB family protein [Armatimonadetes bacterium]|nr:DinB family protein [Armatimonadota bacterium]
MKVQEFLAQGTEKSASELIRQAGRLPADKLTWQPADTARNALDQVAECAVIGRFIPNILETRETPKFDEESMARFKAAKEELDTLEKASEALQASTALTAAAIRAMPDEALEETMQFFGPEPWTILQIMGMHKWNMDYHCGQICYIQTLLGDKDMF